VALRLSTVGSGVFDGSGDGVSEADAVSVAALVGVTGVSEACSVKAAIGGKDVFVADFVSIGAEVAVVLQATEISTRMVGKISFGLIS